MTQREFHIPDTLLSAATIYVRHPRMQETFGYGIRNPGVFKDQLQQLDRTVRDINMTSDRNFAPDMVNTHKLKAVLAATRRSLPLVLDERTQRDPKMRDAFKRTLRAGGILIGSYFLFPLRIENIEQRLGAGVLDAYSFFVPHMLGLSGKEAQDGQGVAVNALCEVLAETQARNPDKPLSLFGMARENKWFKKSYDFDEKFLTRHNLPIE
jgi:hypothetical protein